MTSFKPGFSFGKKIFCGSMLALAIAALTGLPSLSAMPSAPEQQNAFDYTPQDNGAAPAAVNSQEQINLEDIEVIEDPENGVRFVYKHRWKDWIERALYLVLANIAIIGILASLPKNNEYLLIVSYTVAGVSFQFSFWILLCGVLILQLKHTVGFYALPIAAVLFGVTYYLLMKIKKADVDLTELKDAFRQQRATDGADQRLASVDGSPGDWTEKDFLKQ